MAEYWGSYEEELGNIRNAVRLPVFVTSLSNGRIETAAAFDSLYLPQVFRDNTQPLVNQATCSLNARLRRARLWLNNDSYLSVPVPFRPGTSEYNQFFLQAGFNFSIASIGYDGERLNSTFVKFYAS